MKKMIIVLTGVMVLSGLVLAGTFASLTDRIEANRIAALYASLERILPGTDPVYEELDVEGPTIYRATDAGDITGYAVRVQTQGYGGTITMLVGVSPDLETIRGVEFVEQVETPGLGGRITEPEFRRQFADLDADEPITYVLNVEPDREENEVQAISGATITSRAVVRGINATLEPALETIRRQVP